MYLIFIFYFLVMKLWYNDKKGLGGCEIYEKIMWKVIGVLGIF